MKSMYRLIVACVATFWALALGASACFARSGDLFLSDSYLGHKVVKINSRGDWRTFVSIAYPYGIAFDALGTMYVASQDDNTVYQVSPNGHQIRPYVSGLRHFSGAKAIIFDTSGNLFVSHVLGYNYGITKVSPDGIITDFDDDVNVGNFVFDSAGNLLVSTYEGNIFSYTPDGTRSTFATGFGRGAGLAFDAAGNLFVADSLVDAIFKIAPDGTRSLFVSVAGPLGLVFDSDGNLLVASITDGNVVKVAPDGTQTIFATGLAYPGGLAIQP